jgi:uncharacterized protein (TIGR02145 family)/uncharacterized repeat protein (TIGR02543 family)
MTPQIILCCNSHKLNRLLNFFISAFPLFLLLCSTLPESPYQAKNAQIYIILESSDKKIDEFMLVDTVGKTFKIGIRSYMSSYIDSVRISIFSKTTDMLEKDTLFRYDHKYSLVVDTLWGSFISNTEGAKYVIAQAFIQENLTVSDFANINIFANSVFAKNHAPKWGADTLLLSGPADSTLILRLDNICTDQDGDSIQYFLLPGLPLGDTINKGLYTFLPLPKDTGTFYPHIIGMDIQNAQDIIVLKLVLTKYNSAVQDNDPPIFAYVDGPKDNERITTPIDTIIYKITDHSGLDSAYWTLNGNFKGIPKKLANDNYSLSFELLKFNSNRIVIHALDKSVKKNQDSVVFLLNYNTKPQAIFPSEPTDKAVGVDTLPTFSWTGGDDPDGDSVFYKVFYGTSVNELNQKTNEVIGKNFTIQEKLKSYTKYYWKVFAYSKVFSDTSKSTLDSFTTTSALITISKSPSSITINEGDTLILSITASGTPAPKNYQWYHNDSAIANATSAIYKKPIAKAVDEGQYHAVVSNDAGNEAISSTTTVKIICKYSLVYSGNGNTGGVPPLSTNHYVGDQITVASAGSLEKTGYSFFNWNTDSLGSGIDYSAGSTFAMKAANVTLYARWTKNRYKVTYIGNNNDGGSVPSEAEYEFGATVTVASNSGTLTKTGYTFSGWNSLPNGNGTNYIVNSIFNIGAAPMLLYAKWTPISYTLCFNSQGGNLVASKGVDYGTCATEPTPPTKQSYVFDGWFKEAACENKWVFATEKIFTNDTLFAKWIIKDIDGNVYTEVKIGTQVWIVQNLKTTRLNNGTLIHMETNDSLWVYNADAPEYCWYENDSINKKNYGALYNWHAASTSNLAPVGWHVPTDAEWSTLVTYLGGDSVAGGKLKETGTTHWAPPNTGATNETGFFGISTGLRNSEGHFLINETTDAWFWASTQVEGEASGWGLHLFHDISNAWVGLSYRPEGFSVRCLRDY